MFSIGLFPLALGIIIFVCIKNGNMPFQNSPRLIVEAVVVSKRQNMEYNAYYLTFQFESGDRMELRVDGSTYGMLIPGDYGKLVFQGRKFISFNRENFITDKESFY